jgi:hypothetical protein
MKLPAYLSLCGVLWLAGCGDHQDTPAKSTNTAAGGGGGTPVNASGGDYLGTLVKGQQTAAKVVDTAALNQAVQLFNAQEGRNPKDLNELVTSKMIGSIPEAPAGMKLDYDPATGTVKVVKK